MASSFRLLAKTRSMFFDFQGRTTSQLCKLTKLRMMELKQLSRSSQTSTRGKQLSYFPFTTLTPSSVRTGEWVGDCFIYTNSTNRLNYLVGDQTYTISHFDQPMYLLGYIQRDSRIYLCDKDVNVTSFSLSLSVVEYQTLVLRDDMESASELLPSIPADKFELALALGHLPIALELAREADVEHKWKTVGDAALTAWDVALAAECFKNAKDLGSLLLLHSSTGDRDGLRALSAQAQEAGAHNVAFTCLWQLADVEGCIDLLTKTGRTAEAVLFSQTYKPSLTVKTVGLWKQSLEKEKKGRVAKTVGVPGEDDELFPEWEEYLKLESEGGVSLIDVNGGAEESANGDAAEDEEVE
jgi:coatomer subunit beta'